jgi:hypothetical protein
MTPPTDDKRGKASPDAARRERLAAELRANLARRKAQARARAAQPRTPGDDEDASRQPE